jgi:hypothetical protein
MSVAAIDWAFEQDVKPTGRKCVLVALANFAREEDGTCFPGQETLAGMTSQSLASVQRHLAALEDAGLITRERRFRTNGFRTSDLFHLNYKPTADGQCRKPHLRLTTSQNDLKSKTRETTPQFEVADPSVDPSVIISVFTPAREEDGPSQQLESSKSSTREYPTRTLTLVSDRDSSPPAVAGYSPDFERVWSAYPKRQGDNPKEAAFRAYKATLVKGANPAEVLRAVEHYANECKANGTAGTKFVMMASTFLGPDKRWRVRVDEPVTTVGSSDLPNIAWPEGFNLDDEMREWARERGLNADAEFVKFRHHSIDKAVKHREWRGAFREWLDNAQRFAENRQRAKDMMEKMGNFQLKRGA